MTKPSPNPSSKPASTRLKTYDYGKLNYAKENFFGAHHGMIDGTKYKISKLTAWMMFSAAGSSSGNGNKVHITIDRDEENYSKAYDIIFNTLIKYKIKRFKIVPIEGLKSRIDGNSFGKEFVIYMSRISGDPENSPELWIKMLSEIELKLAKNKIKPGDLPKGDLIFPGSLGYIFQRSPMMWSKYLSVKTLDKASFTAAESARLTEANDKFFGTMELNGGVVDKKASAPDTKKDSKQKSDKDGNKKKVNIDSFNKGIQKLIIKQYCKANDKYDHSKDYTLKLIFVGENGAKSKYADCALIAGLFPNFLEKCRSLTPAFERSAEIVAKIHLALSFNLVPKNYVGDICPALYFKFFLPLVKFVDNIISVEDAKKPIADKVSDEVRAERLSKSLLQGVQGPIEKICNENELVEYLVKCSLRDQTVSQIRNVVPKYILELTEEEVSELVAEGMKKTPAKVTSEEEVDSSDEENIDHSSDDDSAPEPSPLVAEADLVKKSGEKDKKEKVK